MIVVVGAGVAGLAAARALARAGREVTVLEAGLRVGGLVHTELTPEGLLLEHGPDSLMMAKPGIKEALEQLALTDELIEGGHSRSFVLRDAALAPMPTGLLAMSPGVGWEMLRSPLFSLRAKARFAFEPLVRAPRTDEDESVGAFFTRRFGRQVVDRLVDPLLGGVYGVEADRLSMTAVMPRLREQERAHGNVASSMLTARSAPSPGGAEGRKIAPLATLGRGMSRLVEVLGAELRIETGVRVRRIERKAAGFTVLTTRGSLDAEGVVIAVPAWHAAALLEPIDQDLAAQLGEVGATRVDAVTLAWERADVPHALGGSGFVVPRSEGRAIAACTWVSQKWPGRAPDGVALLKVFVRDGARASSEELARTAQAELRDLMGIEATPRFARVHRIERALPRYEVGHPARARAMLARAEAIEGLGLAGNAYRGIGVPDVLASGRAAAHHVLGQA